MKSLSDLGRRKLPPESERPRVIVCGTRTWHDWKFTCRKLDKLFEKLKDPIVCVGDCKSGPDAQALGWALGRMLLVKQFHARWEELGKSAGPVRNTEMVAYAAQRRPSFCIAFWDGESSGTADTIRKARKAGLIVRVIKVGEGVK